MQSKDMMQSKYLIETKFDFIKFLKGVNVLAKCTICYVSFYLIKRVNCSTWTI